jgi:hypothetical protein
MSDIVILREMIQTTAIVLLENYYNKKKITLEEPPPASYSVTIHGMPNDDEVIVIKVDIFNSPSSVFQGRYGECKRADFAIIADTENKKVIIFIEMKAGQGGSEKEIIQQLKGARCFVTYCREIGQSFWEQQNFLDGYEYRFVSIRNISIPKRPTRSSTRTPKHDQPDRMLKITSPKGLQFNQLI